jgi:hypothetical protein
MGEEQGEPNERIWRGTRSPDESWQKKSGLGISVGSGRKNFQSGKNTADLKPNHPLAACANLQPLIKSFRHGPLRLQKKISPK